MEAAAPPPPPPKKASPLDGLAARLKPQADKAVAFMNARNLREKVMLLVFGALFILAIDYWVFIRPVVHTFTVTLPRLQELDAELAGLRADKKNKDKIAAQWEETSAETVRTDKRFVAPGELPALLENLSQLASSSNVKILQLRPLGAKPTKASNRFAGIPIRIRALAGTHDFGRFLASLESGPTFFRVTDLRVAAQEKDTRQHSWELNLETYAVNA